MALTDSLARPAPLYPERPTPKWAGWVWSRSVLLLTVVLHTLAFPPFDVPETAWVFAAPALLWAIQKPRWSEFIIVVLGATFVSWAVLLEWLRHVTLPGMLALALVMALFPTAWFAAARYALPRTADADHTTRLFSILGLAGLWVILEWVRSWFLTGFPWLPLAASQWQRPMMLQSASVGGAWLVSFSLILFNLGLTSYLRRIQVWVRLRTSRFCPEFYVALFFMFAASFGAFLGSAAPEREKLFNAGMVQPYIPQSVKWDPDQAGDIIAILNRETRRLRTLDPDIILWPEAVTPEPVNDEPAMKAWVEKLATDLERPILLGAVGRDAPATPGAAPVWRNGVFLAEPYLGLEKNFYAKRHLVPFGEYVPLGRLLGFIRKFAPIGDDLVPGTSAAPFYLNFSGRTLRIGALVCFEDAFGGLARDAVLEGADVLFVATNDAWFGEAGAAYQHAAHSVLRAVETRRPVIRVGNGGWSGWIDEFGRVRAIMVDDRRSVYYRGGAVFSIDRDAGLAGTQSPYVQYGDWFVLLCACLVGFGFLTMRTAVLRAARLAS